MQKTEKIESYAVIGNGRSIALVSRNGSIDWLCWPRFDSPSIFANLIDLQIGGLWKISPTASFQTARKYIADSNVLETEFHTGSGKLVLIDFMTAFSEEERAQQLHPEHELIRRLVCKEGEVEIEVLFTPIFSYGKQAVKIVDRDKLGYRIEIGQQLFTLHTSHKLDLTDSTKAKALIKLNQGDTLNFSLTYTMEGPAVVPPINDTAILQKLDRTVAWWQAWAKRAKYQGPYRDLVIRSALTLKLLGYAPSGAFIAAATTSLPERLGGNLNWDYRFCWLRDASFTVRTLLSLGYIEETEAFVSWMLHSTRLTLPKLKAIYDVYGERMEDEVELSYLAGYANSKPVRIGNATQDQIQLDVYGEVIDGAYHFIQQYGKLDHETQKMLRRIGNYVCKNWQKKDSGIWEERTDLDHFTYSRLMCWVALDKLLNMKEACSLTDQNVKEYEFNRDLIRKEIEERGWNSKLKAFASTLNGDKLDACMLLMPYYGFDQPHSERMQQTYKKINEILDAGSGLMYRYEKSFNQEGAFLICSFWKVDFIARLGKLDEAHELFKELLKYANDIGLFAEEADPVTGNALGNFPQAFTHLGLINAALILLEKEKS